MQDKALESLKCKLIFDPELNREVYIDVDVYPEFADDKIELSDFILSNFKAPKKKYKKNARVKFIWMIEKDGKSTFLKLAFPTDDKEMEEEVKRIVSILPLYTPAKCGNEPVPCKVDVEFPIKEEKQKR